MGENDWNGEGMKEMMFGVGEDGLKSGEYGGCSYVVGGWRKGGMG